MKSTAEQTGLTLLEVVVAIFILAASIFTLMNIFPGSFAASFRAKNTLVALQLAQKEVESIAQQFQANANPGSYCDDSGSAPACCPILQIVYPGFVCNVSTPSFAAFGSPYNNYYYLVNAAPIAPPYPTDRTVMANDSWLSTLDSTAYYLDVQVAGPLALAPPANTRFPNSSYPNAIKVELATVVSRFVTDTTRFCPPGNIGNPLLCPPQWNIPANIHLRQDPINPSILYNEPPYLNSQHPSLEQPGD